MTANALFGRFVGRESFVHALDPRMKLTLTAALFALVLCAFTPLALAVDAAFIIIAYGVARMSRDFLYISDGRVVSAPGKGSGEAGAL